MQVGGTSAALKNSKEEYEFVVYIRKFTHALITLSFLYINHMIEHNVLPSHLLLPKA